MRSMRAAIAAAMLLATGSSVAAAAEAVIIYTGETHAALEPCRCPVWPDGGLARRAGMIESIRRSERSPVFLFDAGGFVAGGIYDENTRGEGVDRLRTETTVAAMACMRYDAVAVGDEELALGLDALKQLAGPGRLPLTSANLIDAKTGKPLVEPWLVIDRGGRKLGVFGLTTPEGTVAPRSESAALKVTPPADAAREAVKALRGSGAELVVALCHLGEAESSELARSVEGIDVIVNGHRKTSAASFFLAGRTQVLQFDFEARKLGLARVRRGANGEALAEVELRRLAPGAAEDADVAGMVKLALERVSDLEAAGGCVKLDLYTRPECPYSADAEKALFAVAAELGKLARLNVYYVVSRRADGKGLEAMHGDAELEESRRQAAIREFFPERLGAYIAWRRSREDSSGWEEPARAMGITPARIKLAVASGEADELLAEDLRRCERLRIAASPTLIINNRRYDGPFERRRLLAAVCGLLGSAPDTPAPCRALPKCFSDGDCAKPGYVGECVDPGTAQARCVHREAVKVELTLIEDSRAFRSNSEAVIESLTAFLPGIEVRRLDFAAEAGRAEAARFKVERLPAYILGPEAKRERTWKAVADAFVEVAGRLVARPEMVGSNLLATRERKPGLIEVFIEPTTSQACEIVLAAFEEAGAQKPSPEVRVRYSAQRDDRGKLAMSGGIAEIEESLRQTAVRERFPDRFLAYLKERSKLPGSSYWREPLEAAGLPPDEVRCLADSDRAAESLGRDADSLAELRAGGRVVIVASNREVVTVSDREDLRRLLDHLRAEIAAGR